MAINRLTEDEFHGCEIDSSAMAGVMGDEKNWFEETETGLLGTIILDSYDLDWTFVILALDQDEQYRAIDIAVSIETQGRAENALFDRLNQLAASGEFVEELYTEEKTEEHSNEKISIVSIDEQVKQYFKKHPDKLYELHPRKFEELVTAILKDMGLDVELTQATRDGGADIIAHLKNELTSLLILIECKRYSPENKVGVGIIRQVAGIHEIRKAAKSIIITTSTFTKNAIEEANAIKEKIDLKDYQDLKQWLQRY